MYQTYLGEGAPGTDAAVAKDEAAGSGSSLSVLRTFRLLRILKLVRFMPQLRRQLFVMLRTMDNVAIFFSLLVLFIFIFRWESNFFFIQPCYSGRSCKCYIVIFCLYPLSLYKIFYLTIYSPPNNKKIVCVIITIHKFYKCVHLFSLIMSSP